MPVNSSAGYEHMLNNLFKKVTVHTACPETFNYCRFANNHEGFYIDRYVHKLLFFCEIKPIVIL